MKSEKLYSESKVELNSFSAKNYDRIMNIASFGLYYGFIRKAIRTMDIQSEDKILDLGCGTGRNALIMNTYLDPQGKMTCMDNSSVMEEKFNKKCGKYEHIHFIRQRIDRPFNLLEKFDKLWISFVIHGFPQEVRLTVLDNVFRHLKTGGQFFLLDFSEFNLHDMPALYRFVFQRVECKYAFDFIKRDWKKILSGYHFAKFEEIYFFDRYVRLLKAEKAG